MAQWACIYDAYELDIFARIYWIGNKSDFGEDFLSEAENFFVKAENFLILRRIFF